MQNECNFFCSKDFNCFKNHAARIHEEYFVGKNTNLDSGKYFKLCTLKVKIKPNKHNHNCVEDSGFEGKKKKKRESLLSFQKSLLQSG